MYGNFVLDANGYRWVNYRLPFAFTYAHLLDLWAYALHSRMRWSGDKKRRFGHRTTMPKGAVARHKNVRLRRAHGDNSFNEYDCALGQWLRDGIGLKPERMGS